jgi:hypothetical protein
LGFVFGFFGTTGGGGRLLFLLQSTVLCIELSLHTERASFITRRPAQQWPFELLHPFLEKQLK